MTPVFLILCGFILIALSSPIGLLFVFLGAVGLLFKLVLPVAHAVGEDVERVMTQRRRDAFD